MSTRTLGFVVLLLVLVVAGVGIFRKTQTQLKTSEAEEKMRDHDGLSLAAEARIDVKKYEFAGAACGKDIFGSDSIFCQGEFLARDREKCPLGYRIDAYCDRGFFNGKVHCRIRQVRAMWSA